MPPPSAFPTHPARPEELHVPFPKNTTWSYAEQLTTGAFTGKGTDDLLVRWIDGETTIYPGVTGKDLPGEIKIRPAKSNWTDATVVAAGAFTANTAADDILVRRGDGHVSLFPGVDAKGLHDEVRLVGRLTQKRLPSGGTRRSTGRSWARLRAARPIGPEPRRKSAERPLTMGESSAAVSASASPGTSQELRP